MKPCQLQTDATKSIYSSEINDEESAIQLSHAQVVKLDVQQGALWQQRSACFDAPVACEIFTNLALDYPQIQEGYTVLAWLPKSEDERCVVLGRVGPASSPNPKVEPSDQLVLTARKEWTPRCGNGSVTILGDGKILIKGKDLVYQTQYTNRVKGGAVSTN